MNTALFRLGLVIALPFYVVAAVLIGAGEALAEMLQDWVGTWRNE